MTIKKKLRLVTKLTAAAVLFSTVSHALLADELKGPQYVSKTRPQLGLIMASDGSTTQAAIDFYRAVYTALSQNTSWDVLPITTIRQGMASSSKVVDQKLGGIPSVDRASFRKHLPKRSSKSEQAKVISGSPVPEIQRFLDSSRSPAVIVVDCSRMNKTFLKACGLYYYDRVASKVTASSVKSFVSGASDVTAWATPMLRTLEEGIASAQREKNHAVIEELIARNEDEDEKNDTQGLIGIYGFGDRLGLDSGWRQTASGAGLQLGFLENEVGAYLDAGLVSWKGSGELTSAKRTSYSLGMIFRARALESLLWYLEAAGGVSYSIFKGPNPSDELKVESNFLSVMPGIGLEVSEIFSLNIGVGWRWTFENSSKASGALKDVRDDAPKGPALSLRAMILL